MVGHAQWRDHPQSACKVDRRQTGNALQNADRGCAEDTCDLIAEDLLYPD